MLAYEQKQTNIFVGLGVVLMIASRSLPASGSFFNIILGLVAAGCMIWGCANYAKGKGHSPYWGLLGFFYLLGFIILFFFTDRHKQA